MISSIVVTGSSGTIGTALSERLLDAGYEVYGVDVVPNRWSDRVAERTTVTNLMTNCMDLPEAADLVVHLAANARVRKLVEDPGLAKENYDTTYNVLEYARNIGADVVFSSSREVYASDDKIVYNENDTYVDQCKSPYTASKIGGEALIKSYGECYDIDTGIVRLSNVYDKYDSSNRVIPLFIAQAIHGDDLTVYDENKVLDFLYIDDCVTGIMSVINQFQKVSDTTINIASGKGISLIELAETVRETLSADISVNIKPNRTGEISRCVADIQRARKVLGYNPVYNLEDGIEMTVEWYQSHQHVMDDIRN